MPHVAPRPPGPRGLPLLGSALALAQDILGFLMDLGRAYGDVSYARVGLSHLYSVNDPLMIEDVLIGKHRDCIKDFGTRELIPLVGRGLLTSEGEHWRRQRKLAAPPLQPKRIASYAETMVQCAERELDAFRDGEVRDIHVDMMRLTLEIVGKTLLGFDARGEAERVSAIADASVVYIDKQMNSVQGLLPQWVPTPTRYRFRKAVRELDALVYRVIERCRAQGDADHLLARLVQARDENGEPMSDVQLRDEAVTMLLAGHETTALTLTYAAFLLARHPAAAARLREEIDQKLGGRSLGMTDLQALPFLDAVVKETLRLYPPVYVMGREVVKPFEVGGYLIPAGHQVMMSPYVMQRDPRYFDEPVSFKPERWLEPAASALPRFAYFPFGGGPRTCIGNHFATMEVALVLGTLLQRVELEALPGFVLRTKPIVTMRPEGGVPMRVKRRAPASVAA